MRIANMETVKPGNVLGKSVFKPDGTLLIPSGFALTPDQIEQLHANGLARVYLMDFSTKIPLPGDTLRDLARRTIQIQVSLSSSVPGTNPYVLKFCTLQTIQQQVEAHPGWKGAVSKANPITLHQSKERTKLILERVLEEYRPLFLAFPERMIAQQECERSLQTAILSLIIGQEFDLPEHEMRLLAAAALTRDLGMTMLEPLLAVSTEELSKDERMMLREHTIYTAMLLRGAFPGSDGEQAIVLRHQERLDGSGYPLGLKSKGYSPDSPQIDEVVRLSEILAITAAYVDKVTGRYRKGTIAPVQVVASFIEHDGKLFNSYVVRTLCNLVQHFPVGSQVRIRSNSSGRYAGYCGVVKAVPDEASDLPAHVVLLTHSSKETLPSPLEVDFSRERHLLLEMLS